MKKIFNYYYEEENLCNLLDFLRDVSCCGIDVAPDIDFMGFPVGNTQIKNFIKIINYYGYTGINFVYPYGTNSERRLWSKLVVTLQRFRYLTHGVDTRYTSPQRLAGWRSAWVRAVLEVLKNMYGSEIAEDFSRFTK